MVDTASFPEPAPPTWAEVFGLHPLGPALAEARASIAGADRASRTRFGLSSARIFKPSIGLPTWLGRIRPDRRAPIYNYFNRVAAPRDLGYSVRCTYARDYRGGRYTYDGHLGTDFAIPVGTTIVAAAPGFVVRVANDMGFGGLKVCIDHGGGLLTTSNHLSRALVRVGDRVGRAEPIALSGASGLEFVLFFPWVAPHLHFNVWLDGEPVDPFSAGPHEAPLWRTGNDPIPARPGDGDGEAAEPSAWDEAALDRTVASCTDASLRARLASIAPLEARAAEVLVRRNYRSALFRERPSPYVGRHERAPRLDLPLRAADFVGVAHPDHVG